MGLQTIKQDDEKTPLAKTEVFFYWLGDYYMNMERNPLRSWSYVLIQALLIISLVYLSNEIGPNISSYNSAGRILQILGWAGIFASAYDIRTVLTAEPLPRKNGKLTTSGLYKYVRHPMYTSVLILCLGIALPSGSIIKYGLVICLSVLFYFKSEYEEYFLNKQYKGYSKYSEKTPRFIPLINKEK